MENILAIWKPKGPTSHDIVDAVRRITGERRVGHAGTLDPMAEGVLVIGIGREATRKLKDIVGQEKEYVATMRLGATSSTDDSEGEITPTLSLRGREATEAIPSNDDRDRHGTLRVPRDDIERVLRQFIGRVQQIPPVFSAVKVRGKPAHRRVRSGEDVTLAPRIVEIRSIEVLRYEWPSLDLRVVCGPGTYIRALARDIGAALVVGGYLTALTRTRVGAYTKDTAFTLGTFARRWRGSTP